MHVYSDEVRNTNIPVHKNGDEILILTQVNNISLNPIFYVTSVTWPCPLADISGECIYKIGKAEMV